MIPVSVLAGLRESGRALKKLVTGNRVLQGCPGRDPIGAHWAEVVTSTMREVSGRWKVDHLLGWRLTFAATV